MMLQFKGQSDK